MPERQKFQKESAHTDRQRKQLVAAVLLLLRRRARKLASQKIDPMLILGQLARELRDHIYLGRREARRLAIESLQLELKAVGYHGIIEWSGVLSEQEDLGEAVGAGRGYLNIVWKRYQENLVGGSDQDDALDFAIKDSEKRLRVVAKTALLGAFAVERTTVQRQLVPEGEIVTTEQKGWAAVTLIQVWNVTWCKGTCDICEGLEHTWRPLLWSFPYGPPTLHPNCGCYIDFIPIAWAHDLAA